MPQVEVRLRKKGPNGIPHASILVPKNIRFDSLVKAQQTILRDRLRDVGLKACEGCLSGISIDIGEKFDKVVNIEA